MPWDVALGYTGAVAVAALSLIFAIWAAEGRPKTNRPR
jgi:hypothetical protein